MLTKILKSKGYWLHTNKLMYMSFTITCALGKHKNKLVYNLNTIYIIQGCHRSSWENFPDFLIKFSCSI